MEVADPSSLRPSSTRGTNRKSSFASAGFPREKSSNAR